MGGLTRNGAFAGVSLETTSSCVFGVAGVRLEAGDGAPGAGGVAGEAVLAARCGASGRVVGDSGGLLAILFVG